MIGPGKYDDLCTLVRKSSYAKAALVIVIDGEFGDGFSCQGPYIFTRALPTLLRAVANDIEKDIENDRSRH